MVFSKHSKWPVPGARRWLGAVCLAGVAWMAGPAWAELPATHYYGSVEYVTGGFGLEESTALKNAMPDYPLAFTFAARNGNRSAYVAKVQLVVRDQYDATILNVESQGSFLLARLMPGSYQVHATYENETQSRSVTVTDNRTTRVVFEWSRHDDGPASQRAPDSADQPHADHGLKSDWEFAPGSIPGLD